jgi:hypothetical protein
MVTKAVIPLFVFKGKLHLMSTVHAVTVKKKMGSMRRTYKLNINALKELCLSCNI